MTIRVFPNKLTLEADGLCDQYETDRRMTVEEWLIADGGVPRSGSISVRLNGDLIPENEWRLTFFGSRDEVVICIEPKGADPFSITVALFAGVKAVFSMLMPQLPGTPNSPGTGDSLSEGSAKGNKVKLGDPIREAFGLCKIYPDYLLPSHKYFSSYREQQMELALCVGKGEFEIFANNVRIGDTPLLSFGTEASYQFYGPGEYVGANPAFTWWHTAPEVGSSSTGAAGLELTATTSVTQFPDATTFSFSAYNISADKAFPTDWDVGLIIRIEAPYTYTVTDGGGTGRDVVSGPLNMLNPTVGDTIEVSGINAGIYEVAGYDPMSQSMTLNYENGNPANQMTIGEGLAAIGPEGLRFRITGINGSGITVERLDTSGSADASFPGFGNLTTSSARIQVSPENIEGGWRGWFAACPENELTDHVQWDMFFPEGLCQVGQTGNVVSMGAYYTCQWRDAALGPAAPVTEIDFVHTNNTLDQGGYTTDFLLPYRMRPQFRFRKRLPFGTNLEFHDTIQWYGLRAKLQAPTSYPGVTTLGVKCLVSDRIAAQTESLVHVIGTRILPYRRAGSWMPKAPTREIGPAAMYVAKTLGYTDADLDLIEFDRLGDGAWLQRNDTFNKNITEESTAKEVINSILNAGFAELTIDRGMIRPVRDEPRSTLEHMYTPQNMTRSLSRDVAMPSPDDYDGVQVTYTDRLTWAETTVNCQLPGEPAGRKLEKINADGVIDRDKAYQLGMRRRRAQVYRRDTYNWSTEMDALNSRYWSYCAVADDVPGYGQSAILMGWTSGNNMVLLESSEPLDWSAVGTHVVALRRPDGTVSGPYTATRVDDYRLTVAMLDFTPEVEWVEEPPHILFGPVDRWTYKVLVTEVNPSGYDSASVSGIGYDARVYLSDDSKAPD